MRMQDTAANCGPASLSNALAAMGITRSQDECAALCKTNGTEGTPPKRILAAIKALGRAPVVIREKRGAVALLMLDHSLRDGRGVLLCVDNEEHWVAAVGTIADRTLIADPADNELVLSLSRGQLADRWGGGGTYYGVIV